MRFLAGNKIIVDTDALTMHQLMDGAIDSVAEACVKYPLHLPAELVEKTPLTKKGEVRRQSNA